MSFISRLISGGRRIIVVENASCILCRRVLFFEHGAVCPYCLSKLHAVMYNRCLLCGSQTADGKCVCCACADENHFHFAELKSMYYYDEISSALIWEFKHGNRQAAQFCGRLLYEKLSGLGWLKHVQIITCVASDEEKIKTRGYNQAAIIAHAVAENCGIIFYDDLLAKSGGIKDQIGLDHEARRLNVKDAFHIRNSERITGKSVLVIDDVFTSGATMNECAKVIKSAGAKQVYAATVAAVFTKNVTRDKLP